MDSSHTWMLLLLCALGCEQFTVQGRRCHAEMTEAQGMVKQIDSSSIDSVSQSLTAVEVALSACTKAGMDSEVEQLKKARDQIAAHKERLRNRVSKNELPKLTPEELEALVRDGDPSCPKGQAYKQGATGKEVRCTGQQLVEMNFAEAQTFFKDRGFKLKRGTSPPTLEAEYGAEKYVYEWAPDGWYDPPQCLTIYPRPGIGWQETVARATGARQDRLVGNNTVDTPRGRLGLRVVQTLNKLIIHIGNCRLK
ncbi:MAG: hypothetical protein JW940_08120 [Polyangiaceae bacterium]|nr:hypothetical protein [Polyangiaceae bacterium]